VVLGCVAPVGEQGSNIARIAVLMAGYDESVPAFQINRYCSSGLEAVNIAAAKVMAGQGMAAIGGGVESMSRVPMGTGRRRLGHRSRGRLPAPTSCRRA
jgi:acetyl-CoA C-acetyltransferase